MRITEATLVGVFPDAVKLALSEPLSGVRFRQQGVVEPPYVGDVLTAAYKNVNSQRVVDFVNDAIADFSGVLVIDDDYAEKFRAVRFTNGKIDADTGDE